MLLYVKFDVVIARCTLVGPHVSLYKIRIPVHRKFCSTQSLRLVFNKTTISFSVCAKMRLSFHLLNVFMNVVNVYWTVTCKMVADNRMQTNEMILLCYFYATYFFSTTFFRRPYVNLAVVPVNWLGSISVPVSVPIIRNTNATETRMMSIKTSSARCHRCVWHVQPWSTVLNIFMHISVFSCLVSSTWATDLSCSKQTLSNWESVAWLYRLIFCRCRG